MNTRFALTLCLISLAFGSMVDAQAPYGTNRSAGGAIVLERSTPAEVRQGAPFSYAIRLTNTTDREVRNVTLTETVPGGLNLSKVEPQPTSKTENQLVWQFPDFGPRQSQEINVAGTASAAGNLEYCATVTYETTVCSATRVVSPALVLEKTQPAEVTVCDNIPIRIVVRNTGSGMATGVRITDNLPEGWTTEAGRGQIMFDAGNLAAGQSREFSIVARSSRQGSFTNTATAQEAGGLTAQASASTIVRQPMLTLSKSGPDFRYLGRPAEFTLTVSNTGDAVARDTVVTDQLPGGVRVVNASQGGQVQGNTVQWRVGNLSPGQSANLSVTMLPNQIGQICNRASARAYCAETSAEACMTVKGIPAILLEVVDLQDPVEIGTNTTYVIEVVNQGSADGTGIRVNCTLPPEQSFVSAAGPTNGTASGQSVSFDPLPMLPPKSKAIYKVVVRGNGAGDVRFAVAMTSDQTDSPVQETESTRIY